MTAPIEKFPEQPKHDENPVTAFSLIRDQLASASAVLASALKGVDPKQEPTTYQVYRWLGGAFIECIKKVEELAKAANVELSAPVPQEMLLIQIPALLADLEPRAFAATKSFDLDNLPPGNPREPAFEAA